MIEHISSSSANMAWRCGEQYRRRYIEGEIIPPAIALGRGASVHRVNRINLQQKINTFEDMPLSDLFDIARDNFIDSFQSGVFLTKEEQPYKKQLLNQGLNDTLRATRLYRNDVAPDIQPIDVERGFLIDIGLDLPLKGFIDIEQRQITNDLKTTTRKKPSGAIDQELQPVFYTFARWFETGDLTTFMMNYLVVRKNDSEHQTQSALYGKKHFNALISKLNNFCKQLKAGIFPPASPTSWACSEKYCGYWSTCEYVGNGKVRRWF